MLKGFDGLQNVYRIQVGSYTIDVAKLNNTFLINHYYSSLWRTPVFIKYPVRL